MKVIIYKKESQLIVVHPAIPSDDVDELAKKDVPSGVNYKIIDIKELPDNRDFRGAWEYDFAKNGYDGVGADYGVKE
tara:strand:+ start:986 stop:1216 length:231 start_codon:yes stop_codon:yes gene_type:complete